MSQRPTDTATAPGADAPLDAKGARRAMRRKLAAVVLVASICLGVVVTRAMWQGQSALADGDAAMERGDVREAINRWRRAARWYVPLAGHVDTAYDRLEELAKTAENRGDRTTALMAWRGVRSSIMATRSFYTPYADRLEPANRRIAALMAREEAENPPLVQSGDPPTSEAQSSAPGGVGSESWHYQLLTRDNSPSVFWSIVALLGFAMWVAGGLLFALRGVTADDRLVPRMAAYAGILIAAGLLVWMTGLHLA